MKSSGATAWLEDSPREAAEQFIEAIRQRNARMGIPEKLSGIQREDIPTMSRHVHKEANPLYPVPVSVPMNAGGLEQFYYNVADWSGRI